LTTRQIDIGLNVLDHQLLDRDGRRCGNVDGLAIEGDAGEVPAGLAPTPGIRAQKPHTLVPWEAVVRIEGKRIVVRDNAAPRNAQT
jgi:hypothetical protein